MNTAFLGYHLRTMRGRASNKGFPAERPRRALCGELCGIKLEVQLQGELDLPRIVRSVARGANFTES